MTNRSDLTVALRIQADVAEAVKRLGEVDSALDRLAPSASAAAGAQGKLDAAASKVDGARVEALALANQAVASAAAAAAGSQAKLADATARAAKAQAAQGVSAGQTAAAMRQLPAQLTDVVTSLASGQPAWMVLIQQGGQIKDSFGGVGPALKNVTSLLTPMRVGLGLGVAAVGALAAAYLKAERETSVFNLAVQTTGNYAGATRGRIEELAQAAHQASGISVGAAREIATGLVQSGRLGIETIGNITQSVETYAAVTGQSSQQAAAALAGMFGKPAEGAAKLNEQFHFLSFEQLKYIRTLEEQGRTEEAQLALSRRLAEHMGGKLQQNLGTLELAWKRVGETAASAWDAMVGLGREATLDERIAELEQKAAPGRGIFAGRSKEEDAELARLKAKKAADDQKAADDAAAARLNDSKNKADQAWEARAKSLQGWREKLAEETAKIREQGTLLGKTQAEIDQQIARTAERMKPKASAPKANPAENAFFAQQQSLTVALAEAQQRLKNAKEGVASADDQAVTRLEAWLATNRAALKLDDTRVARLRELAAAIDQAGASTRAEQEIQAARERAAQGLAAIEVDWLAATGRAAEASAAQIAQRYAKLKADLTATGDSAGLARLEVVIGAEQARAQLAALQAEIERVFQAQARQEQSIDAQVSAGLITQIEGQSRLVDLHRQAAQQIEAYLPRLREMAALPGPMGEQARAALQSMETQLIQLRTTTDELGNALRNGLQSGIQEALTGLVNGTMNLRDAIRALALSVADALAQMATKNLAQMATDSLAGLFDGGQAAGDAAGAAATAAAITTAGSAAATAMGAGIGAGGTGAGATMAVSIETGGLGAAATMAASITSAGTAAATTMAAAITSAAAAGGGGGGDLLGSFISAMGFAEGGYTGPGGVYQPAGIVHAGEFVTRQAVTHQPGALAFLGDFNRRGMAALAGWRGYAEGGLVTAAPVAAMPAAGLAGFKPAAPAAPARSERDRLKIVNMLDTDALVRGFDGMPGFERVVLNVIRTNPGSVQQYLAG